MKYKKICKECGKEFLIYRNSKRIFCSKKCYLLFRTIVPIGKEREYKNNYARKYRKRDDCKEYQKKYRKEYYSKNKKVLNEKSRSRAILNRDKINKRRKERRHSEGISKRYAEDIYKYIDGKPISSTKEHRKIQHQKRKALIKGGGKLTIKTIQLVYEDNIKKYGTLTCYLCEKAIPFGKDHLEHKTPLSRGGTNEYNNLGVACQKCNWSKNNKTVEEYNERRKVRWTTK